MHKALLVGLTLACSSPVLRSSDATPNFTNSPSTTSTNYYQIVDHSNQIIARIPSPEQIEADLEKIVVQAWARNSPIRDVGSTNWTAIRAATARAVLTNLALLEAGLQLTTVDTNIALKPPDLGAYILSPPPDNFISSDPKQRERAQAYRAAFEARSKVLSLHQEMRVAKDLYWDRAIKLLVDAYSRPPLEDSEVSKLLTDYSGYDCATQFSNQLHIALSK